MLTHHICRHAVLAAAFFLLGQQARAEEKKLDTIAVSKDKKGFVYAGSGKTFTPWGFNYDHDEKGRLLEDYWDDEWAKVAKAFKDMKQLGANVVRIHLQLGKFMDSAEKPNVKALDQLGKLLELAEKEKLYLDLTGLGCYHKKDVPAWYDKLSEKDRWAVQAKFWEAVAEKCAKSPAIFCYDLMNEPVVPAGKRKDGDWLGGDFHGKHFVQFIALNDDKRDRAQLARDWIKLLSAGIRKHDAKHLVTVGLVDWSLDKPDRLRSGFIPAKIVDEVDFICVHIYPEKGKVDQALETLEGFALGKPVVIEETYTLKCGGADFEGFLDKSKKHACGWVGFFWGQTPAELKDSTKIGDKILLDWLELFEKRAKKLDR